MQWFTAMTAEPIPARRSRGDRQREAIVTAVRELLEERSFADLSVSTISERAGVARSGFYFYFDSKYAVLAVILAEAGELLDKITHHFAPREPGETPSQCAKRMVVRRPRSMRRTTRSCMRAQSHGTPMRRSAK